MEVRNGLVLRLDDGKRVLALEPRVYLYLRALDLDLVQLARLVVPDPVVEVARRQLPLLTNQPPAALITASLLLAAKTTLLLAASLSSGSLGAWHRENRAVDGSS